MARNTAADIILEALGHGGGQVLTRLLGLEHGDLLADKPFLHCRVIPEAALPVLVPSKPPTVLGPMAAGAERLFRQLGTAEQAVARPHLRNRAALGDEVAAAVVKRLASGR